MEEAAHVGRLRTAHAFVLHCLHHRTRLQGENTARDRSALAAATHSCHATRCVSQNLVDCRNKTTTNRSN